MCVTVSVVERFETAALPVDMVIVEATMFAKFALKCPLVKVKVFAVDINIFPFATNVPPVPLIVKGNCIVLPLYVIISVPDVAARVVTAVPGVKAPPETGNVRSPCTFLAAFVNVPAKLVRSKEPVLPLRATESVPVFSPNPAPAVATFTLGAYCSASVPKLIILVPAEPIKFESTSKFPVHVKLVPVVVSQIVVALFNNSILPFAPKSRFLAFVPLLLN